MRSLLTLVLLAWLGGGLSCANWAPPAEADAIPSAEPVDLAGAPSPGDQIAARFARFQTGLAAFEIREVARVVVEESERNGFDWELVLAVIETESSFNNFARSNVGALGLMQIMPATGEMLAAQLSIPWNGASTLFDPVVNVRLGTRYLAALHAKYQTWDGALAAYNWGPAAIDRRLRRGDALPSLYARAVYARVDQQTGL
jgi:soluble lytic murein transglycosylase-like protein